MVLINFEEGVKMKLNQEMLKIWFDDKFLNLGYKIEFKSRIRFLILDHESEVIIERSTYGLIIFKTRISIEPEVLSAVIWINDKITKEMQNV
jgi:hypothetical protein